MKIDISESARQSIETDTVDLGVVQFLESDINSPVVQKIIDYVATETKKPRKAIVAMVEEKIAKDKVDYAKSEILCGTQAKNLGETAAFKLLSDLDKDPAMETAVEMLGKVDPGAAQVLRAKHMQDVPAHVVPGAPKFSFNMLSNLVALIRSEHAEFQTFSGFLRQKSVRDPSTEIIEDKYEVSESGVVEAVPGISSCTTACADPDGRFFYNAKFMQQILNFAYLKGLKPQGKKYICNGGTIPNEYGYAEFIVMHEFKHYTMDDFLYQGVIPDADPQIINYVGDFRTNYSLVKAGYSQIPIGLFSDHVNLDRCKNYETMYKLVDDEMKKFPPPEGGGGGGSGGSGSGKGKSGKGGRSGKEVLNDASNDSHEIGQKKGKKILEDDKKKGKPINKDINDINKHNQENKEMSKANTVEPNPNMQKQEKGNRQEKGKGSLETMNVTKKATYSWEELLKILISKACKPLVDDSFNKYNPKNVTGAMNAALTGAGFMKPGEIVEEERKPKICFVIDASGSMANELELLYANLLGLYHKHPMQAAFPFYLFKVVDDYNLYHCVFSKKHAQEINILSRKKEGAPRDLMKVFTKAGGCENFSKQLADHVIEMMDLGYNILLMSDCNISDNNFDQINRMFRHKPKQMFVIFGRKTDYLQYRTKLKGGHEHLTHM